MVIDMGKLMLNEATSGEAVSDKEVMKKVAAVLYTACSELDDQKGILLDLAYELRNTKYSSGVIQAVANIDTAIRNLEKVHGDIV